MPSIVFTRVDTLILLVYLGLTISIGVWAGLRQTADSFWVNRRRTGFLLLLGTVVSTQLGAGAVVGLASSAYESGVGYGLVATFSTVAGFVVVALLAPRIREAGTRHSAITLGEVFRFRYGRTTEVLTGVITLVAYSSFAAAQFVALGSTVAAVMDVPYAVGLGASAGAMILYTSFSGLRGDILTDFVHFLVMCLALVVSLSYMGLGAEDGLDHLLASLPAAHWSPLTFGGPSFFLGGLVFGAVLGVVSLEIWQRVYAASSGKQARRVFLSAAALIVPFYGTAVLLGLAARVHYGQGIVPDTALIRMISDSVPQGARGLFVAALLAAFLSTANSMLLVMSSSVVRNFLPAIIARMPGAWGNELRWGRGLTLLFGVLSLVVALGLPSIVQLTLNAFYILGLLFPPLIGIVWKRATPRAAVVSMVGGVLAISLALPWIPRQAFLVGAAVAIPAFIGISFWPARTQAER